MAVNRLYGDVIYVVASDFTQRLPEPLFTSTDLFPSTEQIVEVLNDANDYADERQKESDDRRQRAIETDVRYVPTKRTFQVYTLYDYIMKRAWAIADGGVYETEEEELY